MATQVHNRLEANRLRNHATQCVAGFVVGNEIASSEIKLPFTVNRRRNKRLKMNFKNIYKRVFFMKNKKTSINVGNKLSA